MDQNMKNNLLNIDEEINGSGDIEDYFFLSH